MMEAIINNPPFLSGVVAVITILATKGVDLFVAKWKSRDEFRHTDRELLSKDEQDFRLTIIKQLQQCRDEGIKKDEIIDQLRNQIWTLKQEILTLRQQLNSVGKRLEQVTNVTDVLAQTTDSLSHQVEETKTQVELTRQKVEKPDAK